MVTCDVTVSTGVTLTIEPGVVIGFQGVWEELIIDGPLLAQGTEAQLIVFASYKDDEHGGDTSMAGSGSLPSPRDWGSLNLRGNSSGSVLNHTWIGYGAYGGIACAYANVPIRTRDSSKVVSDRIGGSARASSVSPSPEVRS